MSFWQERYVLPPVINRTLFSLALSILCNKSELPKQPPKHTHMHNLVSSSIICRDFPPQSDNPLVDHLVFQEQYWKINTFADVIMASDPSTGHVLVNFALDWNFLPTGKRVQVRPSHQK